MLAEIDRGVRLFNLDTGYQFPETLELRERLKDRYGMEVEFIRPESTVAEYENEHGGPLYRIRPDQCCHDRKVLPLRRAVLGYQAWISAIRRDQTNDRAVAEVVQWDAKFSLVKINPLLGWTARTSGTSWRSTKCPTTRSTIRATRALAAGHARSRSTRGEDERAGRWVGP